MEHQQAPNSPTSPSAAWRNETVSTPASVTGTSVKFWIHKRGQRRHVHLDKLEDGLAFSILSKYVVMMILSNSATTFLLGKPRQDHVTVPFSPPNSCSLCGFSFCTFTRGTCAIELLRGRSSLPAHQYCWKMTPTRH